MAIDMLDTLREMTYYFSVCRDNAADNSKAKDLYQHYMDVLVELCDRIAAEEDDGK